jgi:amino acid permease
MDPDNLVSKHRYSVDPNLSPDSEQELLLFERRVSDDLHAESGRETSHVENEARGISLKREITPLSGVGFVIGSLIGSGIFITPSVILNYSGSFGVSMVCWVFGAVVALAGALCYLELGMVVRKTGGEYAISLEAYSFRKKNSFVEGQWYHFYTRGRRS